MLCVHGILPIGSVFDCFVSGTVASQLVNCGLTVLSPQFQVWLLVGLSTVPCNVHGASALYLSHCDTLDRFYVQGTLDEPTGDTKSSMQKA